MLYEVITQTKKRIPQLFYDQADKAFYRYTLDFSSESINLVQINAFKNIESYYSTLFHEITHSTKNPKRLGREVGNEMEELVAEMGAMIICTELGLAYNRQNSITYLKGWSQTAKDLDIALVSAYGLACDAAEYP